MRQSADRNSQSGRHNNTQMMAFWLAALCIFLMIPQIWWAALWLTENVLIPQLGYDLAALFKYALFLMIFMAALYAARAALATSVMMAVLFAMTKLPIF